MESQVPEGIEKVNSGGLGLFVHIWKLILVIYYEPLHRTPRSGYFFCIG